MDRFKAIAERKRQGLSQRQLARLANISHATVSRFENGKEIRPTQHFAIREALNLGKDERDKQEILEELARLKLQLSEISKIVDSNKGEL